MRSGRKRCSALFILRHPNVVYIYDSFTQDHLFYLALERCDHPLRMMLGTPMQEGLVLEMSRPAARGRAVSPRHDVVHDDLHAGNVLIVHTDRPDGEDQRLRHQPRAARDERGATELVHHAIMAPGNPRDRLHEPQSDLYQVGL
jgi:serine/threonine-protein kinase